jgi:hypothetical protein
MAILGTLVERATHRVAARLEKATGWVDDRNGADAFVRSMGREGFFASAAPQAMAVPVGEDVFLWRAADKASRKRYGKPFEVSNQGAIGSCVAHGAHHAVWIAESLAWDAGLMGEVPYRPSTPSIYGGSRVEARGRPEGAGGYSDGSTGFHAAKWLRDWGVIYQREYPEFGIDLTRGQALEKEWGNWGNGGRGDNGKFDNEAKRHPIKKCSRVTTWDELVQSLSAGFPMTIASNVGFQASARDAFGFIPRNGTWPHQMCLAGLRWKKNGSPRDGVLVLNSWSGAWPPQGGGKFPPDQPDGSFWISRADAEAVLAAGDSWSFSTSDNWEPVPIDHGAWFEPAPAPVEAIKPAEISSETSLDDSGKASVFLKAPQPARIIANVYSLAP